MVNVTLFSIQIINVLKLNGPFSGHGIQMLFLVQCSEISNGQKPKWPTLPFEI
jgi:hypothetical protein